MIDLQKIERVLIIKPSSMGDVVHALPVPTLLKENFPHLRIRWVVNPEWAPLIEGHPHLESVEIFPRRSFKGLRAPAQFSQWSRQLRKAFPAELAIDLQGLMRSGLIAKGSGASERIGLSDAREGSSLFHTTKVDVSSKTHAVDRYLAPLASLGVSLRSQILFPLPAGERPLPKLPKAFVLLHPFARGAQKSLTPAQITLFCEQVSPSIPVVIAGVCDDDTRESLDLPENTVSLLNRTSIPQLIWLLQHAIYNVSVDSGPMHIASAVGSNLLGIHTRTNPLKVGPYHAEASVWKAGTILPVSELAGDAMERPGLLEDHDLEGISSHTLKEVKKRDSLVSQPSSN